MDILKEKNATKTDFLNPNFNTPKYLIFENNINLIVSFPTLKKCFTELKTPHNFKIPGPLIFLQDDCKYIAKTCFFSMMQIQNNYSCNFFPTYTRRGKTWACFNACRFLPVCTTPLIFFLWAPTCVYIDHKKIRCRQTKTFCLVGYWRYRTLFRFTSSHSEITSRKLFSIKDGQKVIWQIFYEDIKFCPWFLTHFEKQNSKIDRKISEKSRFSAAGVPYSIVLAIHPASP